MTDLYVAIFDKRFQRLHDEWDRAAIFLCITALVELHLDGGGPAVRLRSVFIVQYVVGWGMFSLN